MYVLDCLAVVNFIALTSFNPLYIGSFLSFIFIITTPGLLILPFLTPKKFPALLGIAFSVALSLLSLMLVGLVLNTILPFFGMNQPLSTIPLLIAFDVFVCVLFAFNYMYKKDSALEFSNLKSLDHVIVGIASLLPIMACLGAVVLNNGGTNVFTMVALVIVCVLVPVVVFTKKQVNPLTPPLVLYMMALAFLLMNSMRGWFISGHDILLEYHVFTLTNAAQLWDVAVYQDPYNACLSLTILPTYLQQLMHAGDAYIFKFFTQFFGALSVVMVYFFTKRYVSEKLAFLAGFLYISFPTFLVDMAFLNRQGIAFLFFGSFLYTLLNSEFYGRRSRIVALFLFGIGVVISHYSTSYVMIALLIGAYVINSMMRLIVQVTRISWLSKMTDKLGNKEMYKEPILLTLPLVIGLLCFMFLWSTVFTKTSTSLFNTIQQIAVNIEHPFSADGFSGPAKYGLFRSKEATPEKLFNDFLKDEVKKAKISEYESVFYPLSLTRTYHTIPLAEKFAPLTPFGQRLQTLTHVDLTSFFKSIKQLYAKIMQALILVGVIGVLFGYAFKGILRRKIPVELIAISIAGLVVMIGQTVLPGSAIDYGLLRLFQQNLMFLVLPIILGFMYITGFITSNHTRQLAFCTGVLLFFFVILSGLFTQVTGGAREPLALDNSGLYYDSYYVYAQEVASIRWLVEHGDTKFPIQAAHFSDIKMIAYGHIGAYIELLPETTKRSAYVYLNYDNVKSGNILEIVNGNVVYYTFPMNFLDDNKDKIYSNGGSEIYR